MGGTKIVVLQLKEIIKSAVFVLVALALIILLVYLFVPKDKNSDEETALYIPGTYSSQFVLNGLPVDVYVTVDENEILSIELTPLEEVQTVFYPLVEPTMDSISAEILRTQSLEISQSAENMMTSQLLLDSVESALSQAKPSEVS